MTPRLVPPISEHEGNHGEPGLPPGTERKVRSVTPMSRDKLVSIHMTGVRSQALGGVSEERWVVPFRLLRW
jgi:hypothetical protein